MNEENHKRKIKTRWSCFKLANKEKVILKMGLMKLKRIGVLSAARVYGAIGAVIGLI